MLPFDSVRDWCESQSMETAFGSYASMFDAQALPKRRSQGSRQGFLNLAPVGGRIVGFSYQGMLAEIFEHLTDVREHESRNFGVGGARVHVDNFRNLTANLHSKFIIISLLLKLHPFIKQSEGSAEPSSPFPTPDRTRISADECQNKALTSITIESQQCVTLNEIVLPGSNITSFSSGHLAYSVSLNGIDACLSND